MQREAAKVLVESGMTAVREHYLSPVAIVDILVDGCVAVECKIQGSPSEVLRQLRRYAVFPQVTGLVLLTAKVSVSALVPTELCGKRVVVIPTALASFA